MPNEGRFHADLTSGFDESGPGMLLDRYPPLQRIGEGGMGEVWLAEQKDTRCGG